VHDTVEKTWRHLNFFEHECHLHARVPRVETPDGRVVMVVPPWAGKLAGFTLLFEALLLKLCVHMPVHQVSLMTGVSDFKLWRMLDLYVAQARYGADWSDISAVGMDETSVAKGHDYITMFVDTAERKTLFVTEGKDHKTVAAFEEEMKQHKALPEQIRDVSCDMSPAFIKGVKEHLPKAQITFDKFHIIKILNEAVDTVRRAEAKTNPLLKGTRYIFLKNEANLTEKQRAKKQELDMAELNLDTMQALQMRETFQQLYAADTTETFIQNLRKWVSWVADCGLTAMEKAAETIVNHWDGIIAWKKSQLNNGILEGLNSVIQAAKRKARGYKPDHFITIAYLLTAKLNFKSVNRFA
jgi:transposase